MGVQLDMFGSLATVRRGSPAGAQPPLIPPAPTPAWAAVLAAHPDLAGTSLFTCHDLYTGMVLESLALGPHRQIWLMHDHSIQERAGRDGPAGRHVFMNTSQARAFQQQHPLVWTDSGPHAGFYCVARPECPLPHDDLAPRNVRATTDKVGDDKPPAAAPLVPAPPTVAWAKLLAAYPGLPVTVVILCDGVGGGPVIETLVVDGATEHWLLRDGMIEARGGRGFPPCRRVFMTVRQGLALHARHPLVWEKGGTKAGFYRLALAGEVVPAELRLPALTPAWELG